MSLPVARKQFLLYTVHLLTHDTHCAVQLLQPSKIMQNQHFEGSDLYSWWVTVGSILNHFLPFMICMQKKKNACFTTMLAAQGVQPILTLKIAQCLNYLHMSQHMLEAQTKRFHQIRCPSGSHRFLLKDLCLAKVTWTILYIFTCASWKEH